MPNISEITGNIFNSGCQTLVNAVNCHGVMGAGIALEFRLRLPDMYAKYVEHCRQQRIDIGKLWLYKPPRNVWEQRWILNFPTKRHWRHPARISYLKAGLDKFLATYRRRGIESAAFPILGSDNGGLDEADALAVMRMHLERCDIPVEIYRYDPLAVDDQFEEFRTRMLDGDVEVMSQRVGVRRDALRKVMDELGVPDEVRSMSQLASIQGIHSSDLEKCFRSVMKKPARIDHARLTSTLCRPQP